MNDMFPKNMLFRMKASLFLHIKRFFGRNVLHWILHNAIDSYMTAIAQLQIMLGSILNHFYKLPCFNWFFCPTTRKSHLDNTFNDSVTIETVLMICFIMVCCFIGSLLRVKLVCTPNLLIRIFFSYGLK